MTSAINPALPIYGFPTTASVRSNFQIAHDEITALQAFQATGPFLPLAGGHVTGAVQIDGVLTTNGIVQISNGASLLVGTNTLASQLWINGPAGSFRTLAWTTNGLLRFRLNMNSTAEAGANAGSNLDLNAFDDTGAVLAPNPLIRITRATGAIAINSAVSMIGGLSMGNTVAPGGVSDLSKHIALASTTYGFSFTNLRLNVVIPSTATIVQVVGGTDVVSVGSTGMRVIGNAGFYNTAPIAKQTVAGAWAGNAAGKALSTALAALGLITDTTSA